ncbi:MULTISPECIES: hypothetical protein [Pseudomonas]|nr:hypothetical protein [Pseudomonas sp. MG-9]
MFGQQKKDAVAAWRKLATQSQGWMAPQDQYNELLKAADDWKPGT